MPSNRHIHQYWSLLDALYRLTDGLAIAAGLSMAATFSHLPGQDLAIVGAAAIALFYLVASITGLYRSWRGAVAQRELVSMLWTWAFALLALLALGVLSKTAQEFSRKALLSWSIAAPILAATARLAVRRALHMLRTMGFNTRGFAIVGVNNLGIQLARNIEKSPDLGLKLVGFFDDRPAERLPDVPPDVGLHVGDIGQLIDAARAGRISMVYITFPMRAEDRIRGVLNALADTTASVYIVPDFFVFELLHSRWTDVSGLPVVSIFEHPFYGIDGLVKRTCDLVLASLLMLFLAVPMSAIAILIKLTSRGPVFFRQRRYGLDGREILVWKFRSMTVCEDGATVTQAKQNDARVTPLGAVLRKTSLDELPQLFNVLGGSMSLVGPRPHANAHNEQFRALIQGYMLRHKVKPGITGLAQVNGWRGETDTPEKMERRVECDHQYIRDWSLWLDFKILLKTVWVVFARKNAY